jgi:hypothetical protein
MTVCTFPYAPDVDALCAAVRIEDASDRARFAELLGQAAQRPGKAVYAERRAEAVGDAFPVRLFREKAAVYPFAVTCGPDMEAYGETLDAPLEQFWWDAIMLDAVSQAYRSLKKEIESATGWPPSAASPGMTDEWPLGGQPALFALIGDVGASIGLTLSESYIMRPFKSMSGIFYQGDGPEEDMV